MAKGRINWDHVKWTPFEEAELRDMVSPLKSAPTEEQIQKRLDQGVHVFVNSIYQVEVKPLMSPEPFGRTLWLSFKTRDKQPRHDWREMQRIKNELVGEHYEGVEVFPDEDRLVDTSNQYHMYVFIDYKLPFGLRERLVSQGSMEGTGQGGLGYRQRDFRPEFRPADLLPNSKLDDLKIEDRLLGRCPHDGSSFRYIGGVWTCLKHGHQLNGEPHGEG